MLLPGSGNADSSAQPISVVSHGSARDRTGVVYLVGAGPGDPDLITVQGLRCLHRADAVVYDRLVHPALLDEAPTSALRFDSGKAPGHVKRSQEDTQRLLIRLARRGLQVVRLKGGDPFVFGRGGEEALALTEAGIPWRVVPGVTSAVAGPASAGIPLTHRGVAASFTVVTGHRMDEAKNEDLTELRSTTGSLTADTVVGLMAVRRLDSFVARCLADGKDPDTPAAMVERATLAGSRTLVAPLLHLPQHAAEAGIRSPATVVVGEVVALRFALGADLQPTVLTSRDDLFTAPSHHVLRATAT
ncbi:MAG: uroporphyrinogen-III C-methyltransferase [Thermoanaerobaculia bacterium]|nr:uroporphyrinogen-III C-methyltransferase [Thermoanaerobaculia bacterium]